MQTDVQTHYEANSRFSQFCKNAWKLGDVEMPWEKHNTPLNINGYMKNVHVI
jgi:hypothetical protein